MAGRRAQPLGVKVLHPNRRKPTVMLTRAVVVLLLLASIGLMVLITVGGWSALAGMKAVQIGYIAVYAVLCIFALRWKRGVLPLSAALAVVLAIFALLAVPGWLDRNKVGFAAPALPESMLATLCGVLAAVQLLLIAFAMRGFMQGWNVEEEVPLHRDAVAFGDARAHPA